MAKARYYQLQGPRLKIKYTGEEPVYPQIQVAIWLNAFYLTLALSKVGAFVTLSKPPRSVPQTELNASQAEHERPYFSCCYMKKRRCR